MHYFRVNNHGDPGPAEPLRKPKGSVKCKHPDGCDGVAEARGWCRMHYHRFSRTGDPGPVENLRANETRNVGLDCSVYGCDRPAYSKGLCGLHYRRVRETGDVGPVGRKRGTSKLPDLPCSVDGCVKRIERGDGMCGMHSERVKRNGHPGGPLKNQLYRCKEDTCVEWVLRADLGCKAHRVCTECAIPLKGKGTSALCQYCYQVEKRKGPCEADGCSEESTPLGKYCSKHRGWSKRSRSTMQAHYAPIRQAILEQQGGKCALCGTSDAEWHLDHDHRCCGTKDLCRDCIRGVLCAPCNMQRLGSVEGLTEVPIEQARYFGRAIAYVMSRQPNAWWVGSMTDEQTDALTAVALAFSDGDDGRIATARAKAYDEVMANP